MKTKAEIAKELFLSGYNCSQAVFGAFCEDYGIPFEQGMMLSGGFGGGFARRREVCGAISGATMVISLERGYSDAECAEAKTKLYEELRAFYEMYESETGSIVCRELLSLQEKCSSPTPEARTEEYYKKRPCAELVALSAGLTEKYINELRNRK